VSARRRIAYIAAWAAVIALFLWSSRALAQRENGPRSSLAERLLGPVARLAADIQWVRSDSALRHGETALAYARAESALRLAPSDPGGWIFLAHHFLYERASLLREPDPLVRREWIRAGLDLLARGEERVHDPSEIAFYRGIAFAYFGSLDDADRIWPASRREAWELAADAFERSAELGHVLGAEAGARARELATESDR
jgi:hypothetical protein